MLGRLGTVAVVLAFVGAPASAVASSQDQAATQTYLTAAHTALQAAVASMNTTIAASIESLNARYRNECPDVGAGSPQSEEEQRLSYEVAGALWSTAYHADAGIVKRFVRAVQPLRWSNPAITRGVHAYDTSLLELVALPLPNLCGDVRTWRATGFGTVPSSTIQFDRHVEAIEGKPVTTRQLAPYLQPSDRALAARDETLNTEFEHMETLLGQGWWDMTLETLALNQ